MNGLYLGCAILVSLSLSVIGDQNCTASCEGYKTCSTLKNNTAFLNNSLSCNADNDKKLGDLFTYMDDCKLNAAAIVVADLMKVAWDGVSSIEAIMSDEEFWLDTCEYGHMAAAACVYFSLPEDGTCTNKPNVEKSGLFCPDECMKVASSCMNLGKYKQLNESITSTCNDITDTSNSTNCYKAQISQEGLHKPDCNANVVKSVSLTGPYIVGAVGLALAVVAIVGLALITIKRGDAGVPNSF